MALPELQLVPTILFVELRMASNGGPLIASFTGTVSALSAAPITAGSVSFWSLGPLNAGSTVIATTGGITYNANLNLIANAVLDSSLSGGNIVINGTIDGAHNMNLIAGLSDVHLNGSLGSTTPLNILTFASANNLTTGAVQATSIVGSNIGTLASFNGALYNGQQWHLYFQQIKSP